MVLTGASWDVWGFNFKQYDDYYWSWKPNVLEKAILAERRLPLFDDQGTTMCWISGITDYLIPPLM